ncbi:MAG TPA: hypothetical protein VG604_01540 [Candidatus Saccharimonadales bacterium]|nr:hypothetical protein [Candidatus Saccharimonadales bacterium]
MDTKTVAKWILAIVLLIGAASVGPVLRLVQEKNHAPRHFVTQLPLATNYAGKTVPAIGKVILPTTTAHGNYRSKVFSVSGSWNLYWALEDGYASTGELIFSVTVYDADGKVDASDKPISEVGIQRGFGTLRYKNTGKEYVVVKALKSCSWTITAKTV